MSPRVENLTSEECRRVASYLMALRVPFTHDEPQRLAKVLDRAAEAIESLTGQLAEEIARRREFPDGYRLPEILVVKAMRELHMTREEIDAKVAQCVSRHRAKGTPFKRHDLAAWNWLADRFVTKSPRPEPPAPTAWQKPATKTE